MTSGSRPNEAPTSRFDTTRSGRYEPVPIILVRIIMCECAAACRTVGGIIGLGATGVNFVAKSLHSTGSPATFPRNYGTGLHHARHCTTTDGGRRPLCRGILPHYGLFHQHTSKAGDREKSPE